MKRIFYLVHYNVDNDVYKKRVSSPAAQNKVEYIISTINDCGYGVDVISPSITVDAVADKGGLLKYGYNTIKYFRVFGIKNFIQKTFTHLSIKCGLMFHIIKNVKKDDVLIAYHSLYFMKLLNFLKKIKKFKLVLEIEEIYADVINNDKVRKKELSFFKKADSYIFPTELLNEKINLLKKPYAIIYGTYNIEKRYEKIWNDDKIHIVYAGTLDPRKGCAVAVAAAEFLSEKYHIHILGFGSEKDKECILKEISRVNSISECTVTYDGCLSGEEYIKFIQSCDIGLSPQDPKASFNATSFPSKILSYLSNGLHVVSIKIPAIEQSSIGNELFYYDEQTSENVANAIKNVNLSNQYNGIYLISQLGEEFKSGILKILEDSKHVN